MLIFILFYRFRQPPYLPIRKFAPVYHQKVTFYIYMEDVLENTSILKNDLSVRRKVFKLYKTFIRNGILPSLTLFDRLFQVEINLLSNFYFMKKSFL